MIVILVLAYTAITVSALALNDNPTSQQHFGAPYEKQDVKVPVVLGVMSRCPDAQLCESVFEQVLRKVDKKVDISLTFIGKLNTSEPDFGITCKHGPLECAGNVQELCAQKYLPQRSWWNFVQCLNYKGLDQVGNPDPALKCSETAGFDWEESGVGECAGIAGDGKGKEGIELLRDSVEHTKSLGIEKSCTIIINHKQVCIHDEIWKECENGHTPSDFIRQINDAYDELNA